MKKQLKYRLRRTFLMYIPTILIYDIMFALYLLK